MVKYGRGYVKAIIRNMKKHLILTKTTGKNKK